MRAPLRFGWRVAMSLLVGAACGCTSGTETGNPTLTGQLSYTGYSSAPLEYGVREQGSVARIDNAWFDLDALTVSSAASCGIEQGEGFTVEALGVGDHAAGNHNFKTYQTSAGSFCSVGVPFVRVPEQAPASAPDELLGHAVLLIGELADGTPFSISSDTAPLLTLTSQDGFSLSESEADVLLAFDFAAWLQDLDFSTAAIDAGEIVIAADANLELLQQFESNFSSGVVLYRDRDGDGRLDVDPEELARSQ